MIGFYNMKVAGENYGEGKITAWDGRTMTVRFENCEKRFWFPLVFTTGALKPVSEKDDALMQEVIKRWMDSVLERETMGINEQSSDDDVQEVIASTFEYMQRTCDEAELAATLAQTLSKLSNKEYGNEGNRIIKKL